MRFTFCVAIILGAVVGCQKAADTAADSTVAASPAVFNAAGAPIVQFKVPDMMCEESCAKAVHDTLAAQPGAVDVKVDFPNRLATVAIDEQKFDSEAALAALLDKQFAEATLVGTEHSDAKTDTDKSL
ncbi:heavy-metal-associated domain-containing protein [Bythopirellula polymerisocia]|uniref:Heavy-metal-associated domain protein n=1 Tax=Bythopirellula polymerisocia TaxID=2528003 RepID=A0A5C6CCZ1_9BACT|nr:heavy-metal-associated domain-containing protein [Bythopirellula polymerisocia]TWU21915.1 Heavy-metal-associated domain protein [Bythopirellula polymerisocia]